MGIDPTPRMFYATEQVERACADISAEYSLQISINNAINTEKLKHEGFHLKCNNDIAEIFAADQSGVLYGCLELAGRIRSKQALPSHLEIIDDPVLRNALIIGNTKLNLPEVNIHAFTYETGIHTLEMIGSGSYIILGIVPDGFKLT